MSLKSIREAGDLSGKKVLVRVDWSDGDEIRIQSTLPTLDYLIDHGAKVIIATHVDEGARDLQKFVPPGAELLPNLRANSGEESNSEDFARELAGKADIFINEAFPVSHREHASIVGVPKLLPSFIGFQFEKETEHLSKAFNPQHPFLFILGGAKFETKIPLVKKFLDIADHIHIAGANAVKVPEDLLKNPKVSLPLGDIAALDADEANLKMLEEKIGQSAFVLWNGPLGKYEDGYKDGTRKLAQILADSGKEVIVGGADTLEVIQELNILDKFSFVSTGGGSMLEFLATGTLPGIEALKG